MRGPWSFDKYLLGLYKLGKNKAVKNARFEHISFWMQIHDLPMQHMNKENTEAIGNSMGLVEQVDASPTGDCRGKCLRDRVNMDMGQPLCHGIKVDVGESSP